MTNARFSILQARAIGDARISNAQFRTLAALGIFGDKDGWCFPKLTTLGEMLGKTKQAVSKDIQALVDLGYVEVTRQFRPDGSQQNNLYRLLFDTRQRDVNPHQRGVYAPSTPEVDPPSTPEVDALTPQYNAPIELYDDENIQNVFKIWTDNCGPLTPIIADELILAEKEYGEAQVKDAITEAVKHNARSIKYVTTILENRKNGRNVKPENKNGNHSTKADKRAEADAILAKMMADAEAEEQRIAKEMAKYGN